MEAPHMFRSRRRAAGAALLVILALILAACSSTGGKKATEQGASAPAAGKANTPHYTFAVITHAAPGDTFWDIIRKGVAAAAATAHGT
jgi:simple sugar transport system substrate-binding protein